jgi:predicted HicB family RNase H-like nuclease
MAKQKLTLYIDEGVTERAKIRAVKEKTSLSQIAEELLRERLKQDVREKPDKGK